MGICDNRSIHGSMGVWVVQERFWVVHGRSSGLMRLWARVTLKSSSALSVSSEIVRWEVMFDVDRGWLVSAQFTWAIGC